MIIAFALACAIAFLTTPILRQVSGRVGLIDRPNERSSHVRPTPRSGGIAIVLGLAVAAAASGVLVDTGVLVIAACAAAVAILGVADDALNIRQYPKFAAHLVAAGAVIGFGDLAPSWLGFEGGSVGLPAVVGALVALVWVVWMINAYNFMDGANGLAAVGGVVIAAALAVLLAREGDRAGATFAIAIAGAAAGFLPWNFPRASIFMGDAGSTTLGFAFAALVLRIPQMGGLLVAAVLPLSPYLFDATLTVLVRMRRGERFFSTPHKLHLYQRLITAGWTHSEVTLLWGGLAILSAGVAVIYEALPLAGRFCAVVGVAAVHGALAWYVIFRVAASARPDSLHESGSTP